MTATDELRRLLCERGVEYENLSISPMAAYMSWRSKSGLECRSSEFKDGSFYVSVFGLTPEQAVEATLGRNEESYDAGFKTGVRATLQQLYGLLHDYPTLDDIEAWADRQWEEEL